MALKIGGSTVVDNSRNGTLVNLTMTGTLTANGSVGTSGQLLQSTGTGLQWATLSSIATASNLAGGTANQIPYQTGAGATTFITAPVSASTYLQWNGTAFAWATVSSGTNVTISNDTTTTSNVYPLFSYVTSGTASSIYTGSPKYTYKPSTGELSAPAMVASNGVVVNTTTISSDYTVATGTNAFSVGPITVASGATLTVADGQKWLVV